MWKWIRSFIVVVVVCAFAVGASADVFGTGLNQFTLDFVPIAGDAGDLGSWPAGDDYTFTGVDRSDYRMGMFEITNNQWNKFENSLGVPVTGTPASAYDQDSYSTGTNVPTTYVSWYEAAQFVNWLNTSTGHQAAYKFTGTQGTGDYAPDIWSPTEAAGGTNLYRHKDAMYYLPTEDEWVKAAYWNGSWLQSWATPDNTWPVASVEANYNGAIGRPWDVGSGSEELNGTYDMMGNVYELMESPYFSDDYGARSDRGIRGGSYNLDDYFLASDRRDPHSPGGEYHFFGFRVAAEVPEPSTLGLLSLGALMLLRRRRS